MPLPDNQSEDDDKGDDQVDENIQTLLLPDMLDKRLNSIINKCNTWVEETGINVLRAAFGFLEWTESESSQPALAPIILLSVEIEKRKTREGFEYAVSSLGEAPEVNTVLMEKLKREFGIELPAFNAEENSLEDYFKEVNSIFSNLINGMTWRVRRQVAVGIFPSARMAMYHDLDTSKWGFADHEVIKQLLCGNSTNSTEIPFGEEYEVDAPHIEQKVPLIVTDADASQFSVLVDVMDGKNVAVEGPPGSGKSQTIVNMIAVALSLGLKVLFVAEKTAALEVVRSRLEACELGEFLLTLQATRSTKEKVIGSIRERLELSAQRDTTGLEEKITQFKSIRAQIGEYIQTISQNFAETDFTVHHILGRAMEAQKKLLNHLKILGHIHIPNISRISQENINEIIHFCNQLEVAWVKAFSLQDYWCDVQIANLDPYTADEILRCAEECSNLCERNHVKRVMLSPFGIDIETDIKNLISLKIELEMLDQLCEKIDIQLLKRMLDGGAYVELTKFFQKLEALEKSRVRLSEIVVDPLDGNVQRVLECLAMALGAMSLREPSIESAEQIILKLNQKLDFYKQLVEKLDSVLKVINFVKEFPSSDIIALCDIKKNISRTILSLRSSRLESPDAKELIIRASQKSQTLLNLKNDLPPKKWT